MPRFLVFFKTYEMLDIHNTYFTKHLKKLNLQNKIKIINRHNPATLYPTDFTIIEIFENNDIITQKIKVQLYVYLPQFFFFFFFQNLKGQHKKNKNEK